MGDCLAASASGPAPASGITLLTFDVDGTLIRAVGDSANKLHKDAFAHAMRVVFDLDTNIDVIKHHGSTDQLVLADVLRHHGVDETRVWEAMPRMMREMVEYFESHEEDASLGLELLPGVERLLEALSKRKDVIVCLVTGNLEPVARGKMRQLGVWRYFTPPPASTRAEIPFLGGFGSDHTQRDELVRLARDRVLRAFDLKDNKALEAFETNARVLRERVHFGDTPNDVKAAAASGAVAFAVTTGVFSKQELEAHFEGLEPERCVVFDGLEDTQAVLEACGLK
jgi:phosphoglycolate phosphatase